MDEIKMITCVVERGVADKAVDAAIKAGRPEPRSFTPAEKESGSGWASWAD